MVKKKIIITESQYKKIFLSEKYRTTLLSEGIFDDIIDLIKHELGHSNKADDLMLKLGKKTRSVDDVEEMVTKLNSLTHIDPSMAKALLKLDVEGISSFVINKSLKSDEQLYNLVSAYKEFSNQVSKGIQSAQTKLDETKRLLNIKGINDDNIDLALRSHKDAAISLKNESMELTKKLMSTNPNKWSAEDLISLENFVNKKIISSQEYSKVLSKQINGFDELWELLIDWKKNYSKGESSITFSKYLEKQRVYLGKWGKFNKYPVKTWDWFAEPIRLTSSGKIFQGITQLAGRNILLFGSIVSTGLVALFIQAGFSINTLLSQLTNWLSLHTNVKKDILKFLKDDSSEILLPDGISKVYIYGDDKQKNDFLKSIDEDSLDFNTTTKFLTLKDNKFITLNGVKYTTFKWSQEDKNLKASSPTTETEPKVNVIDKDKFKEYLKKLWGNIKGNEEIKTNEDDENIPQGQIWVDEIEENGDITRYKFKLENGNFTQIIKK